jgi:hypothetical protein
MTSSSAAPSPNDKTYPLVWIALSLDPIDRKPGSP